MLNRAFELAQAGVNAESEGRVSEARDMLAAAIDAFKAVLLMPGFLKDKRTRALIEAEIGNLQERRQAILTRQNTIKGMEARYNKLTNPHDEEALRDRLKQLNGMDKPAPSTDEISLRLKALKGEDISKAAAPNLPGAGSADDWKQGLDADIINMIEQTRDETL